MAAGDTAAEAAASAAGGDAAAGAAADTMAGADAWFMCVSCKAAASGLLLELLAVLIRVP